MFDDDVKIAAPGKIVTPKGEPSLSEEYDRESAKGNTEKARLFGAGLAREVVGNLNVFSTGEESGNSEMAIQRGIMMTFAAIIGMEEGIPSSVVAQTAKNSFNAELESLSPALYKSVNDSGAFSFYYLAYRRGTDVVRRMGQTFAMLCSHDGDPVYQELGEAIYCWFKSFTARLLDNSGIN